MPGSEAVLVVLVGLLLTLVSGLVRVFAGPSLQDRMMALQLMGTVGVGILLVLHPLTGIPAMLDAALVLALLAAVATVAVTRQVQHDD